MEVDESTQTHQQHLREEEGGEVEILEGRVLGQGFASMDWEESECSSVNWRKQSTESNLSGSSSVDEEESDLAERHDGGSKAKSVRFNIPRNPPPSSKKGQSSGSYNFAHFQPTQNEPTTQKETKVNFGEKRIATILKKEDEQFRLKFPTHPALKLPPYVDDGLERLERFGGPADVSKAGTTIKKSSLQGERKVFFGSSLDGVWKMKVLKGECAKMPESGFKYQQPGMLIWGKLERKQFIALAHLLKWRVRNIIFQLQKLGLQQFIDIISSIFKRI